MLLVVLAAVLLMPTALALDQEEILQDQSQSLGIEDLEEAGEAYTGQHDIEDGLDVGASFRHMAETGKEALGGVVKRSVRSCVLLLWNTLPLLETIRDVMEELADLADISPTVLRPMLQTVGLALVTKLAASLCRDAGEGGVASFVEVAGAAAAVLVSLPLLKMVLQLVMGLL